MRTRFGTLFALAALTAACGNNDPDFGDTSLFEVGSDSGLDLELGDILDPDAESDTGTDSVDDADPDVEPDTPSDSDVDEVPDNCGNGALDEGDDGNDVPDDGCTNRCTEPVCGDAIVQDGEGCDDGNDDDDACTTLCEFGPTYVPCYDFDLLSETGDAVLAGSTSGLPNNYESICGSLARGGDVTALWTAPADGTYAFDLSDSSYDTVLHTYDYAGVCGETLRECDDDSGSSTRSRIETDMVAGEPILLIIDGFGTATGSYVLDIDLIP